MRPIRVVAVAWAVVTLALPMGSLIAAPVPPGIVTPVEAVVPPAASSAPATGPIDPQVRSKLSNIIADGDIQTRFTVPPPERPPSPPPEWLKNLFGWMLGDGNGVIKALGWLLVGLIVLGALYLTVPWVRDLFDALLARLRRPRVDDDGDTIEWRPDESGARNLLAEADRLAADGQFEAAAHLLLGRSLEDIANRRPGLLKPALTARAIALMGELPAPARTAFGRIAATVERSLWARLPLDQSAWQDARAAYEDFAFGPHWRGAAA